MLKHFAESLKFSICCGDYGTMMPLVIMSVPSLEHSTKNNLDQCVIISVQVPALLNLDTSWRKFMCAYVYRGFWYTIQHKMKCHFTQSICSILPALNIYTIRPFIAVFYAAKTSWTMNFTRRLTTCWSNDDNQGFMISSHTTYDWFERFWLSYPFWFPVFFDSSGCRISSVMYCPLCM